MRILSVDDSAVIRKFIRSGVEAMQFEMVEACDGKAALHLLAEQGAAIDLILLDWNMPEMDGLEFLHAIKSCPSFRHIPVMMVTTESERENMIQAVQAGAINYLIKPFTLEELTQKIEECVACCVEQKVYSENLDSSKGLS
ncbi:MAG: response regulator [Sporomusaceae bacterium]|nr:response regulator [Sporomusaceae bacterium]